MCGEYLKKQLEYLPLWGSPPHVWRILEIQIENTGSLGITSTCVENTKFALQLKITPRDHLHMCGEYTNLVRSMLSSWGSPPHVWRIQL